jgi:hypothetical protein
MSTVIRFEQMYLIKDAGGNLVWQGAAMMLNAMEGVNVDVTAGGTAPAFSCNINVGEAVVMDQTTGLLVIPRWDYANTGTDIPAPGRLALRRVAAIADTGVVGVALETAVGFLAAAQGLPAPTQKPIRFAPVGSICCVKCVNPPTSNTLGAVLAGSATQGSVNAAAPANVAGAAAGIPAGGTMLGRVVVVAGNTLVTQTGSLTQIGVLVNPA